MKVFKIFIILLFPSWIYSQVGGESVYNFLNISTSATQSALGGKSITLADDINQPLWNPSIINENLNNKLALNYTSYLSGINIGSAVFATKISRRFGMLHAGIKYVNYGNLIESDEFGAITGNFSANDFALSVGYAYNFPFTNIFIGANVKLIQSSIGNFSSSAIATDIGILYHNIYKPYLITLVVRNIGTQVSSFINESENLPMEIILGGSYQLVNVPIKWHFTIDNLQHWNISFSNPSSQNSDIEGNISKENISFFNNAFRHFIVGAELFPDSVINLHFGYNFRKSQEYKLQNIRTFGGLSFGFGLKMNNFKFNYAYSKVHTASNVSTFSLQINLDKNR
ncbi:MAG: type IX secretion system protein PorQ [Polaribacter sp.]|nr:type IX secretion system protein PorQ [Polaribacter sp.]MDG1810553.1 type IX secretion system protein PorQ [Polaribacter sp.]